MSLQHILTGNVKLGKKPPRIDSRTLKLAKYLVPDRLAAPPAESSWVVKVPSWPMYGNDTLGDCVEAAAGHYVDQVTFFARGTETVLNESDIIAFYSAAGGYVPGDPSTDNGTDMLTALNIWRQQGIGTSRHKIYAYMAVDYTNTTEVMQAITLFGSLYTGIQLPISAQGQDKWTVVTGGPFGNKGIAGGWGGHCVPIMAYSPITLTCVTWGERLKMSHNFFADYVDESYVVLSEEWIGGNGMSPSGFNLAQLDADLAAL